MFLILSEKDIIYYITTSCQKESDGSYIIDDGRLRVLTPENFKVLEVETLPEEVEAQKYCYSETKGFYANPDYVEPVPEPTMADLQEQIAELSANLDYMSMVASVDLPDSEEE